MTNKIKLYEYDYASYFTGNIIEIDETQGYQPGYLTMVPVPEIPEGHFARFDKSFQTWEITANERPVMREFQDIFIELNQIKLVETTQEEPTVI
jgi:hypothetical protein